MKCMFFRCLNYSVDQYLDEMYVFWMLELQCRFTFWWKYLQHTSMHAFIHTYIHIYIHTYIHTYIYIHIHIYVHTYIQTKIHSHDHTDMKDMLQYTPHNNLSPTSALYTYILIKATLHICISTQTTQQLVTKFLATYKFSQHM